MFERGVPDFSRALTGIRASPVLSGQDQELATQPELIEILVLPSLRSLIRSWPQESIRAEAQSI